MTTTTESRKVTAQAIFSLFNLGCSSCSAIIERKLKKVPGVNDVTVNYVTDTVLVNYDNDRVTTEEIREFMRKLGYEAAERQRR